jgi:hypothetical protein
MLFPLNAENTDIFKSDLYLTAYHDVCDPVICANREDKVSRFALGLSNQETSILSLFKYQLLCLLA